MSDTHTIFQKLNNNDTVFFVRDTPTVTFNDNVTVFIYPKTVYIQAEETEYTLDTLDTLDIHFRKNRIYTKILLFFKSVKKIGI